MYDYDKEFYLDYDQAGRTDESFQRFLKEWVYGTKDHEDYLNRLGVTRLTDLKVVPGVGYHVSDEDMAEGETI
jgi:glutaconate CoA-transferase subunit A